MQNKFEDVNLINRKWKTKKMNQIAGCFIDLTFRVKIGTKLEIGFSNKSMC